MKSTINVEELDKGFKVEVIRNLRSETFACANLNEVIKLMRNYYEH